MFNSNNGYSLSDVVAAMGGNNGWGNENGLWWLIALVVLANGGFGFGGFGGYGMGGNRMFETGCGWATRADISDGFTIDNITSGIRAIQNGICDATYALDNTINNGFSNAQLQASEIASNAQLQAFQNATNIQNGITALGTQLASCCCDERQAIANGFSDLRYNLASQICDVKTQMANSTRDLIDNNNANTRSIIDFLVQSQMAEKDAEIASLKAERSNSQQTAIFMAALDAQAEKLSPCPKPAYVVNAPYQLSGCCNC